MKPLSTTDFLHPLPSRYMRGTVVMMKTTLLGHRFIDVTNVEEIEMVNGTLTVKKKIDVPTHFIIPKRRVATFNESKGLIIGETYIFKLVEETRSKRYMVSEIFLRGGESEEKAR